MFESKSTGDCLYNCIHRTLIGVFSGIVLGIICLTTMILAIIIAVIPVEQFQDVMSMFTYYLAALCIISFGSFIFMIWTSCCGKKKSKIGLAVIFVVLFILLCVLGILVKARRGKILEVIGDAIKEDSTEFEQQWDCCVKTSDNSCDGEHDCLYVVDIAVKYLLKTISSPAFTYAVFCLILAIVIIITIFTDKAVKQVTEDNQQEETKQSSGDQTVIYVQPAAPGYGAPPQGYAVPPQGYVAPQQGYGVPPQPPSYGAAPAQGYAAPPGAYAPPGYAQPPPGYGQPPPGYGQPVANGNAAPEPYGQQAMPPPPQ